MSDFESSDTPTPEASEPAAAAPEPTAPEAAAPEAVAPETAAPETVVPEPAEASAAFAPVVPPTPAAAPTAVLPPVPPTPGGSGDQIPPAAEPPQASGDAVPAKQRSLAVPIIAAAVVAGLLGGGAGAGVATWAITSQSPQQQSSSDSGSNQTITVNNPNSVDVVNAVAAKAAGSVVTISVAAGNSGGTGSGVILSDDGYVLTNTHVVTLDGASADGSIEVTTADGRIYSATVVGMDPVVDLAVIKLKGASGLTPVEWGDSDTLDVGDQVIAIGAPLGLSNTVTDGIVSALGRSIQIQSSAVPDSGDSDQTPDQEQNGGQGPFDFWQLDPGQGSSQTPSTQSSTISLPVIQTDAAINPGNSGGALLDDTGRLVGINVAIASTGTSSGSQSGSIGVGFSIPSSLAKRVAEELIENGEASHGLLGATVSTATSEDSDVVGALIQDVPSGGAADSAGLAKGDVVTSFNGVPITSSTDLTAQVRALAAGSTAKLSYQRDGKETTVEVTLGKLDS